MRPTRRQLLAGGLTVDPHQPAAGAMLVRRRDLRAYHPDADPSQRRVETRFSDFQVVDGVAAPHRNVDIDLDSGTELSTNAVRRRLLNPVLADGYFARAYAPA